MISRLSNVFTKIKLASKEIQSFYSEKDLVDFIIKNKQSYRITYFKPKKLYLLADASEVLHEQLENAFRLLYPTEKLSQEDIESLLYTPEEKDLKVGFDGNDKVFTFRDFGSIYTKNGKELPFELLNDLMSRFGEYQVTSDR